MENMKVKNTTISIRFNDEELSLIRAARERMKNRYGVSRHRFLKTLILENLFQSMESGGHVASGGSRP
jgi:hypothetical protein